MNTRKVPAAAELGFAEAASRDVPGDGSRDLYRTATSLSAARRTGRWRLEPGKPDRDQSHHGIQRSDPPCKIHHAVIIAARQDLNIPRPTATAVAALTRKAVPRLVTRYAKCALLLRKDRNRANWALALPAFTGRDLVDSVVFERLAF